MVYFSGMAVDPGGQKPLANLPVRVTMPRRQSCTFCGPYDVASGKTRADGSFALTTEVDTTLVAFRFCNISVQGPAHWITYAVPTGTGIEPDANSDIRELSLFVDSTGTAPYQEYDFFQPVLLTLKLHRTGAIVRSESSLSLSFTIGPSSMSVWGLYETPTNADTALTLYTGAKVFTKINSVQFVTDSTKISRTDSIRCVAGASNIIEISYP